MAQISIPTLTGTDVRIETFSPNLDAPITEPATATLSVTEIEFDDINFYDISGDPFEVVAAQFDFIGQTLHYTIIETRYSRFDDVSDLTGFNGYVLTFDALAALASARLVSVEIVDEGTTLAFEDRMTYVDEDSLYVNMDGLRFVAGDTLELRFGWGLTATGGNDVVTGGDGGDLLDGGAGDDTLRGAEGDDSLRGGAGADRHEGGGGLDLADYSERTERVLADLQRDVSADPFARFFTGGAVEGDVYDGIEGAIGGSGADNLRGDAGDNLLLGGGVSDRLYGRAGNDTILGGTGADAIYGNLGVDVMTGGGDAGRADRFIYFSPAESGVGAGNRDIITDFVSGEDRIELSRFDADITQGNKQAFTFVGEAGLGGTAGELAFVRGSGATIVQADLDGDGMADFEIELSGEMTLTESDFLI